MLTTSLGDYEYITDQKSVSLILIDAKKERYLGVDTENSGGLNIFSPNVKLLMFQIEVGGKAYVIDARKVDISPFKEILENSKYIKVVQYCIYDYKILRVLRQIYLNGVYDTKVAECLLDAGISKDGHSLGALSLRYLGIRMDKDVAKEFNDFPYDGEFTDRQIVYAANDVLVLSAIRKRQQIYLNQLHLNPIAQLEFSLSIPVAKMELAGIKVDADRWRESLSTVKKRLFKMSNDIRQILPDPPAPPPKPIRLKKDGTPYANTAKLKPTPVLNLNSPQQLVTACKDVGIDFGKANKITRTGLTNNTTLRFASKMYQGEPVKHNLIESIIKYRGLKQTEKAFGDNLLEHVYDDGRIHASFNQNGTNSGRFSSSNPNLQNIQKKGDEGKILRSCFIPEVGNKFIIADYSQIELRIAAEMSGDEKMITTLNDPRGDIHRSTAAEMYEVPYEQVTSALRRAAKTINFGIIYGMSAKTLADRLSCSVPEAVQHMITYTATYPTLMAWMEKIGKEAFECGHSKTIGGRIRWFPSLNQKDEDYNRKKQFYERVGRNHPIQGTSADMTKASMVYLDKILYKYEAQMVNTVHDELCIEVPYRYAVDVARLIKRKMIFAGKQFLNKVPVLVDVKIRDCWYKDDGVEDNENYQQFLLL